MSKTNTETKSNTIAKQLTYGSTFSGVGGFDLGFDRAGLICSFQIEIDRFCLQVLQKRWPHILRLKDIRHGTKETLPAVDLLCGGFPCQDVSVAGRRTGLSGERSGLWHEFARIIGELRPRWVVIENVPGLLSSHQGRDFGQILCALDEFGYGVAWRILDSQNFGVAQRRRRLFIVGSLGDLSAAEVLFERGGMSGDPAKGREEGEETAREGNRSTDGPYWDGGEVSDTLDVSMIGKGQMMPEKRRFPAVFDMSHADSVIRESPDAPTLQSRMGTGGNQVPLVLDEQADDSLESPLAFSAGQSSKARSLAIGKVSPPLRGMPSGTNQVPTILAFNKVQITSKTNRSQPLEELSPTLDSMGQIYGLSTFVTPKVGKDISPTLAQPSPSGGGQPPAVVGHHFLRRLTPLECERLQGFPDGWTEGCSDTQRYRQMGNAVTVPVIEWLGKRILEVHNKGAKE